jgi:hypothetical protein
MFDVKRTREQGHTAQCRAKALITAIENARDVAVSDCARVFTTVDWSVEDPKQVTDLRKATAAASYDFGIQAQNGTFLETADDMLADGTTECICPDDIDW